MCRSDWRILYTYVLVECDNYNLKKITAAARNSNSNAQRNTAAAVSKKAWYDFTASATGMAANQFPLRLCTCGTLSKTLLITAGGADAISLAIATVTSSWPLRDVTNEPSTSLMAFRCACVAA